MTILPRALSRWQRQLELFPEETTTQLGPLLRRLAPALDALTSSEHEPGGEIDGFDGFARRGSYERLLASEWLLRTYAPLEFLRRAVSGEQAFFQLARREPAARESSLVLFDAGPDQLGDCRLAQLALLVLLTQRAESRGHELHWQLLHRFGEGLQQGLSEASVRSFLGGRTAARSSSAAWRTWREQAGKRRVWLVGPSETAAFAPEAFARVTLRQRVAREPIVDVTLESGSQTRRVALELPPPEQAARLIRDPFEQARAPRVASDAVGSGLLLSPRGNRLFYRSEPAKLVSVSVPNSPRAVVGATRHFEGLPGELIFGVGGRSRKAYCLAQRDRTLRVDSQRSQPFPFPDLPAIAPERLSPCAWYEGQRVALFECAERGLWRADFGTQRCVQVAVGVRDWLSLGDHQYVAVDRWLSGPDERPCVLELGRFQDQRLIEGPERWDDARLAAPAGTKDLLTLATAQDGAWTLHNFVSASKKPWQAQSQETLNVLRGARPLGIDPRAQVEQSLWQLAEDQQRVFLAGRRRTRVVFTSSSPIERACVASGAPVVAVSNAGGELLVFDASGTVLYRGSYPT